jgi:protein TonB
MFETCMVESAGQLRSGNTKWTTAGAFALEGTLLALVVLATMVHTDFLPKTAGIIHLSPPYAPPRVTEIVRTEMHAAAATRQDVMTIPSSYPTHARNIVDQASPVGADPAPSTFAGPTSRNTLIDIIGRSPNPPVTHVEPPERMIVSSIDPATLVQQVSPPYPPLARQAGVQGAVVLHAIIARDGSIESLQVVSGHPMLVRAALDAVRQWRYKPTLLGGQPVEVETTITVNFRLGGQ